MVAQHDDIVWDQLRDNVSCCENSYFWTNCLVSRDAC